MKILIVGGTWDLEYGKKSGLINKIYDYFINHISEKDKIDYFNGGAFLQLNNIIESVVDYDVVLWFANVPNNLPKIRSIKKINPNVLLIGSKRNFNSEYAFVDVLNRTLEQRNNLAVMFSKNEGEDKFKMLLFDPLGTEWYYGDSVAELCNAMLSRILFLLQTNRRHTFPIIDSKIEIQDNQEFIEYVHEVAEIFHSTIQHTSGVTRFMGNASYRGPNDIIFVSERDVDKSLIDKNHFVAAFTDFDSDRTYYYGDKKPSKDTIVQTYLYKMFPNINYIIHSHCYIENGAWTHIPVPCGSLNEIDEIKYAMNQYGNDYSKTYYTFNLKGHGMLLMAQSIKELKQTNYISRNLPEKINIS